MSLLARRARLSETLRRPVVISATLFGLVLGLRAWVQWVGPLPGDRYALAHYASGHPGLPASVIDIFTEIAKPPFVFLTLLVGVTALWWRLGPRVAAGLLLAAMDIIWNAALKLAFGATPLWSEAHAGVNYPSGHVSYVTAVFGYLAWVGFRHRLPGFVVLYGLIILGMGPERVLSGAHLVSDVAGGYLLGLAWLVLVWAWVSRAAVRSRGWSDRPPGRPAPASGL